MHACPISNARSIASSRSDCRRVDHIAILAARSENGRMRSFAWAIVAVLGSAQLAHAGELELKNDGFIDNTAAGFQAGFVAGEMGASRFVAPDAGRQLLKVHFIFG